VTTPLAPRYQPLEAARPGVPLRVRDLQTAQTLLLREVELQPQHEALAVERARASQGIFHPSLVTLFDVLGPVDGRLQLAYEFVPAQPASVVTGGTPLNMRRAAEVVAEVADAAAELHARGIAHGGISLATVMLTLKGKAKLDRVGDPSVAAGPDAPAATQDLVALGDLLRALVGPPSSRGAVGIEGMTTLIDRARTGRFESVATFAALLRRL
jgi:serine/threonine protein kinase